MPTDTIPTADDFAALTPAQRVAFAAKCGRRAAAVFRTEWPDAPLWFLAEIDHAVATLERIAAGESVPAFHPTGNIVGAATTAGVPTALAAVKAVIASVDAAEYPHEPVMFARVASLAAAAGVSAADILSDLLG